MCESWKIYESIPNWCVRVERSTKVFQTDVWELREIYESIPNWYVARVKRFMKVFQTDM
jgi:hypothetical protein